MLIELPEGSALLSYRDSEQELSLVFDNGTSLIRDTVSSSAAILEGRGQKRANMSTVAIIVAFILL